MDQHRAKDLLSNLLERASTSTEKVFLTSREVEALGILLAGDRLAPASRSLSSSTTASVLKPSAQLRIDRVTEDDIPRNTLLCVDFGTSFSKAFASVDRGNARPELVDLPIGDGSTGSRLTSQSELFIDQGRIYFGPQARKRMDDTQSSVDRLIDSIKQFITLHSDVSTLGAARMDVLQDSDQRFSKRDILVMYLAHLMTISERALAEKGISVNVRRRFTHPAWKDASKGRNENEMRLLMAEAIVLARSASADFGRSISVSDARVLLDSLKAVNQELLPLILIEQPVREATAAGAGALLATRESSRESFLIVDIGAGTTDVAGFICVNNPENDRVSLFEITGAANAKNMAGNFLDNILLKMVLEKTGLVSDTEEHKAASLALRRSKRTYKEQLFKTGNVLIELPTDEIITIRLEDFLAYGPVVNFTKSIVTMIAESAVVVAGDATRINLVATGGGASLPLFKDLVEKGADSDGKHVVFTERDLIADGVRETNPELVDAYPQIAVALGGSLPELPEQRANVAAGLTAAPKRQMTPAYKS
ncbi:MULTISPECIES: rod shape-determining protein [Mesorhizobium]|uniref:Hsp70 family protein n=2 Tax=Mesorhizobium TaxID=68287 RepID=A0A1A5I4B0_RHILI|nr:MULTISPECIES: rod shape-determining protein [Mesorhizobium]MBE1706527.1 rod shape-determining protein [Mesorhizobium japonicum]MBE1714962.1 rod shape-determining protein [Mesorhizobium japonicum]MUT21549.1 hypothetical protein [Mesorhizobium japonicum]MUT27400.1 hypothetical protein [Mesorhizobium japonicum]OBP74053.1 hypothetical protein BAE39_16825 [Mesorhizobium loti]